MTTIKLKDYGLNLSGRPLGISTYAKIIENFEGPFECDFTGVISLGSSFADEVIAELAVSSENAGSITVINANPIIKKCLDDVAKDKKISINYSDSN